VASSLAKLSKSRIAKDEADRGLCLLKSEEALGL
jgi:hypothetical protein